MLSANDQKGPAWLFTLGELMKRFQTLDFINMGRFAAGLAMASKQSHGESVDEENAKSFTRYVDDALASCVANDLIFCAKALQRLKDALGQGATWGEIEALAKEVNVRMNDELDERVFFQLMHKDRYYQTAIEWAEVIKRFPETQTEIEEAGRCFACARYTASVFHLMRVMEGGLDGIAKLLTPSEEWFSSWEAYLRKLNDAWKAKYPDQKNAEHRKWTRFFSEVERHLYAIKISLRNPTMHKLEKTYTEEAAEDVYRNVRSLMKYLAVELPS